MPRRRRIVLAVALSACATLASCEEESAPAEFDDDPALVPAKANPDGELYPADRLGSKARPGKGTPGDRIPNLAFRGYVDGRPSSGLSTISLANFYDPRSTRHKVLALQAAATWCSICASEADATRIAADGLKEDGVAFLAVIVSGPTNGRGPSLLDVDNWADEHATNYPLAIDVRARRMEPIGVTGVPWNALIDTRTMEILHASTGAPADIVAYARLGLEFVAKNPPSY